MCHVTHKGEMCSVGTTLVIGTHHLLDSGQMLILSKGGSRFRVTKIVAERPVLICEVEDLPDDVSPHPSLGKKEENESGRWPPLPGLGFVFRGFLWAKRQTPRRG